MGLFLGVLTSAGLPVDRSPGVLTRTLESTPGFVSCAVSGVVRPHQGECSSCAALVAGPALGRYSSAVRRTLLQRWSIILLMVMRLLIGESAHAMPNEGVHHAAASAAAEAPCPDHADNPGAVDPAASPVASVVPHHGPGDDTGDDNCCSAEACKCLCVHVIPMVTPPPAMNCAAIVQLRAPLFADGLMLQRASALFRPPA